MGSIIVKGSEKVVVSKYLLSDEAAAKTFLHDCPVVHLLRVDSSEMLDSGSTPLC